MEIKKSCRLGITAMLCLLSASFTAFVLIFVLSCSEPGASGGEGADFDASSYYTKSEVDAMLPEWETASPQELTGAGWSGRTATGFTVPSGSTMAMVEIIGSSGTEYQLYIQFSATDSGSDIVSQFNLPGDGNYYSHIGMVSIPSGTSTLYGWHDTVHSGAAASISSGAVSIRPIVWFR